MSFSRFGVGAAGSVPLEPATVSLPESQGRRRPLRPRGSLGALFALPGCRLYGGTTDFRLVLSRRRKFSRNADAARQFTRTVLPALPSHAKPRRRAALTPAVKFPAPQRQAHSALLLRGG